VGIAEMILEMEDSDEIRAFSDVMTKSVNEGIRGFLGIQSVNQIATWNLVNEIDHSNSFEFHSIL